MAKTVLVVDDMAIFREPIEEALRANGFSVVTATNGEEALATIARAPADLILLDLSMPVMDGLTTLKKLRASVATREIPVVVLSADAERARIVEAARLGISGYLLKTQFSLQAMLVTINRVLEAPRPAQKKDPGPVARAQTAGDRRNAGGSHPKAPALTAPHSTAAIPAQSGSGPAPLRQAKPAAAHKGPPAAPKIDLKNLKPLMTRSELAARLAAQDELTGFSPTVSQVLKITSNQQCSMDQVAKAVSQDQAVALKILKLANSSVYSRGDRVDTVQKAVLRIGMQCIRQAVLNIGVVERFSSTSFDHHLSTPLFWEHSIACGIIAAEIAHSLKQKESDIAFTGGLLHDLGRVLYAECLGEDYVGVIETARSLEMPLEQVESRLLLNTHAEIMNKFLAAWRFPKELANPIIYHHAEAVDVRGLVPHQAADVLRLGLANRLAHALVLGSSGNETIYPIEEHCRLLDIDADTIGRIEDQARQETDDTKFALLSTLSSTSWPRRVDDHRAALRHPFHPLYLSMSPAIDAFRMFFDALKGPQAPEDVQPTIAIVHIASPKERATLQKALLEAEQTTGAQALPLLVLSPGGQTAFDEQALGSRRSHMLATPTPVVRCIGAINTLCDAVAVREAA